MLPSARLPVLHCCARCALTLSQADLFRSGITLRPNALISWHCTAHNLELSSIAPSFHPSMNDCTLEPELLCMLYTASGLQAAL